MRILVAGKFYYDRGGAEIVARRCVEAYRAAGHEVGVLAMSYPQNRDLPEVAYLAREVGLGNPLAMALRTVGFDSVRHTVKKALDEFRPHAVHLHNVHSYLSPLIGKKAKERGIPVVWTLHDYKLLCGAYTLPRGANCNKCSRNPSGLLRYRCLHDSMAMSAMGVVEAMVWNRKRILEFTDIFVAPSHYMAEMMIKGGFPESRIRIVGNCVGPEFLESEPTSTCGDYFLYVGRLAPEKGISNLLRAAKASGVKLKIAGGGDALADLKLKCSLLHNIEFTGPLEASEISGLMRGAKAVVVPSEWPENNPLVVMEALCSGSPVVGSRVGGIPELLTHDCGVMFEPGNVGELTDILSYADFKRFNREQIRDIAREQFSPERFSRNMLGIIEEATECGG